ncbi:HEAT repeat domain-containing protein [Streptomyces sp. NPDC001093]|uniref:HEAT repeat domain-containing protein n=1 Tax=Streptomyces sp. NPDC001093 TaxID=3154376 RepID=UPI00332E65BE
MTGFDRRCVLKPEVSRDDVELAVWEMDLNLFEMGDEEADVYVDIWRSDDESTEVHYVEDRPIGLAYMTLRGAAAQAYEQRIRESLACWSFDEVVDALTGAVDRDARLVAVYATVLTAAENPEEQRQREEAVAEQLRHVAADPDPGIRQSVVIATGYWPRPALVEIVREIQRSDPEPRVRENARILLEGIRLHGTE